HHDMQNMPGMDHSGHNMPETDCMPDMPEMDPCANKWMLMYHYNVFIGYNHQGGPRGVSRFQSTNWLMVMAEHPAGRGKLTVNGMFTAEPFTAPRGGFPTLFQTGESLHGRANVDTQHPHDLFMELSVKYS